MSDHPTRTCAWHKCRAPFQPTRSTQTYCAADCGRAAKTWRQARGERLVNDLVLWAESLNWSDAKRAAWERDNNRELPDAAIMHRHGQRLLAEREGTA